MFPKDTNILVVDDSSNIRTVITNTLKKMEFYSVESAVDVNSANDKIKKRQETNRMYDLILSDLNMPGPSGIDFLKQIRGDQKFLDLPFILVTTESEKGAVLEAAINGVSSYIVKPFDVATVTKKLTEAWNKHGSKYFQAKQA